MVNDQIENYSYNNSGLTWFLLVSENEVHCAICAKFSHLSSSSFNQYVRKKKPHVSLTELETSHGEKLFWSRAKGNKSQLLFLYPEIALKRGREKNEDLLKKLDEIKRQEKFTNMRLKRINTLIFISCRAKMYYQVLQVLFVPLTMRVLDRI